MSEIKIVSNPNISSHNQPIDWNNKEILLEKFILFIKKPLEENSITEKLHITLRTILKFISWNYVISLLIALIINLVLQHVVHYQGTHAVEEFSQNNDIYALIFLSVIIAPIMEECVFRLLLRYSRIALSVSIFFIILFTTFALADVIPAISVSIWYIILSAGIGAFFLFYALNIKSFHQSIARIYQKYFPVIFYVSVISFGTIHILNYSNIRDIWFLFPLLVMPQIIAGLSFGFIRIRYNIWCSILAHMLFNFFLIGPLAIVTALQLPDDSSWNIVFFLPMIGLLVYGSTTLIRETWWIRFKKKALKQHT